jgi:predicted regulator of Ras-like GTPase activity (Roadblock/LC7/MglB family)
MGFREHLQSICRSCQGAFACSLMGIDGIEVDTYVDGEGVRDLDVKPLLIEYSGLFRNAREAAEQHGAGEIAELFVETEKVLTVARMVSPEYYMVVALRPGGNLGKARFLMRITAPKVKAEL